jgi:hypothetical protein
VAWAPHAIHPERPVVERAVGDGAGSGSRHLSRAPPKRICRRARKYAVPAAITLVQPREGTNKIPDTHLQAHAVPNSADRLIVHKIRPTGSRWPAQCARSDSCKRCPPIAKKGLVKLPPLAMPAGFFRLRGPYERQATMARTTSAPKSPEYIVKIDPAPSTTAIALSVSISKSPR